MRVTALILCLGVCIVPTSISAASASDVMRQFGLVGTWSVDCGMDPAKEPGRRVTYNVPSDGVPTYDSLVRYPNGQLVVSQGEVAEAAFIDETKIRMIIKPRSVTISEQPAAPAFYKVQEIVEEKVGSQMHVLSNRYVDGSQTLFQNGTLPNGEPTPLVAKCGDAR